MPEAPKTVQEILGLAMRYFCSPISNTASPSLECNYCTIARRGDMTPLWDPWWRSFCRAYPELNVAR
jgi:hypothetical protein